MSKKIERFEKRVKTIEDNLSEIKKQLKTDKFQEEKNKISEDISIIKEEILENLDELKKDVDKNADDIKKLEDLSKKVDSFSVELTSLKNEILADDKEKKDEAKKEDEGTPSFFAKTFYGGLVANTLGKLPLIGDSIKSWTEKKVKDSAKESTEEESGEAEKPGFFGRIFKTVLWSGVATGALWLGRKLIPDEWTKEIKSFLPRTDEAKAKKNEEEKQKDQQSENNTQIPNAGQEDNENASQGSVEGDPVVDPNQEKNETDPQNNETQNEVPENNELNPEEEKTTSDAEKMYSEGYSELYILTKMYQNGFVPRLSSTSNKFGMRFVKILQGRPLEKAGEISRDLKARIIQSIGKNRDIAIQMKIDAIANDTKNFDNKADKLISIIDDLEKGKIKSFDDLNKAHPDIIKEFGDDKFIKNQQKYLESIKLKSQAEFDRMSAIEVTLKDTDVELKKNRTEAEKKLKEIDNKAKNADEKTKNKLIDDSKKIVDDYNKKATFLEKKTGLQLTHMNATEIQRVSKIGIADNMIKFNGKVDGFLKNNKTGKFMLGASLFTLASDYASGAKDLGQVGLEVADAGIGMIPFAGGAYDVWTSITGEGIAGDLSTGDRRLRGVVGGVSVILDVAGIFTFGAGMAGSAALKASLKGGTAIVKTGKAVVKTGETVTKTVKVGKVIIKGAEAVMTGQKVLGLGFLGYSLIAGSVPYVYDIADWVNKKTTPDIKVN